MSVETQDTNDTSILQAVESFVGRLPDGNSVKHLAIQFGKLFIRRIVRATMQLTAESEKKEPTIGLLEPEYHPDGIVTSVSTAKGLVREANLKLPQPASPKCNLDNWRKVINLLHPSVVTELASEIDSYDVSKCFRALSVKLDDSSPYEAGDLVQVGFYGAVESPDSWRTHVTEVLDYAITVLPPVTAALMGGFLCEVHVYEKDYYYDSVLPEDKEYGGLHKPFRRTIEITDSCYGRIHKNKQEYPCKTSSFNCTFLHELGHTVHNVYGFLRPGDYGYEYPSPDDSLDSTGCISPLDLTERQSEFVYEMFRSYSLNHRECYEDVHKTGYGKQHPTESFACAFEKLLRCGGEKIVEENPQFHDVLSLLT